VIRRVLLVALLAASGCSAGAVDDKAHDATPPAVVDATEAAPPSPHVDAGIDAPTTGPVTTLPYDGGAVQWDGWAGAFFETYCVSCHNPNAYCKECHAPGDPRTPDFADRAPVVAHAAMVRCGVASADLPAWDCGPTPALSYPRAATPPTNPFPSNVDRGRLVAWLDAGCP
jgi:hypothetical protein